MKRHTLYEVDLEHRTAFCTVCDYTEIYIAETRTRSKPRTTCINRARELWLNNQTKQSILREKRRSQPDWKPKLKLSEINPNTLRAICAICGPTDVRRVISRGYSRYDCVTKTRNYMRKYRRSCYVARFSNPHALSEIDEEKKTAVCAKCGPVKIEVSQGRKKINRRCINVRTDLMQAQHERRGANDNKEKSFSC
jgi:hypothetical protein